MTSAAQLLYNNNINYLKEKAPYLAELALSTAIKKTTLQIDSEGKADLHSGNSFFYNGDAKEFANKEVEKYYQLAPFGKEISGLPPHHPNGFILNRFFSKRIRKYYESINIEYNGSYETPEFYPCLTILGIGLGYHIEKIINEKEILSLIIYETEPEEFITSLYTIDWKPIFEKFYDKGKSIQVIVSEQKTNHDQFAGIWNILIEQTPNFSLATFLYNHRNQDKNKRVINTIKDKMKVFLNLWGYYDDDINQFNNGLHNLKNNHNLLPKETSKPIDIPAFVIGSGPSLDERIDDIRKHKDKAIIISAGTALRSLYKYGIKPDIQVEIESDYEPYNVISEIDDPEYMEGIILIGALQLTPKLLSLFSHNILFTKDSTSLFKLTRSVTDQCKGTTPTCTNTAFAVSAYFSFKNIYLFGTDYGFKDNDSHHSKHSIYYSENKSDVIGKSNIDRISNNNFKVKSVFGDEITTTPIYNTSRSRIEADYISFRNKYELNLYNCSNGADIKNATYLPELNFDKRNDTTLEKDIFLENLKSNTNNLSASKLSIELKNMSKELKEISKKIISIQIENKENDFKIHYMNICVIGQYLSYGLKKYGTTSFIIRGSLWIYLHAGAATALKLQNRPSDLADAIEKWNKSFNSFIEDLPKHFDTVTKKEFKDDDPWINYNIYENKTEDHM